MRCPGSGPSVRPSGSAPGTVAPVLPRVSARQPEPTAGWRDCPRLGSLLAANQWIAEASVVVEPILRRPTPHSLPIESLLVPEAKARPISSSGEKTWSPGKGRGTGWRQRPRAGSFGPGARRANEEASRRVGDGSPNGGRTRVSTLRVEPGQFRDLRRRRKEAADLSIPFLVDSRRYPSIFDVVRDRCGIKRVAEAITTFAWVFRRRGRAEGVREQALA
jgi:hypothetical protein